MTDIFFKADYNTLWAAIQAIAGGMAAIMAIWTLWYSISTFSETLMTAHYTELDSMYAELLRIALEKPYLNNPEEITDDGKKQVYGIYAYMVWNFIETVYDRCGRCKNEKLKYTWYPTIDTENRRHGKWFQLQESKHKFKDEFRKFINDEAFRQYCSNGKN